MGHIDYCSLCKYVYTKDCNYGSKECNQEKARIMLEVSRFEKRDKMLRDTAAELVEAKRLLKSARSIIKDVICNEDYLCNECEYRAKCDGGFSFYWRYDDEALKLIGGSENG